MNIYEIAEECGVSVATVSRVINDKPDVSEKTRQRVLDTIERYDFKPQISKNASNIIGLFVSNVGKTTSMIASPYISELINGISSELFQHGYILSILPLRQAPQNENDFKNFCRKHQFSGAIFCNVSSEDKVLKWNIKEFPVVFIGAKSDNPNAYTVSSQNEQGAFNAVNYLIQMGHLRIMHITIDTKLPDHQERAKGYRRALQENGILYDPDLLFEQVNLSQMDYRIKITNTMKSIEKRPTAFFMCDDFEVIRLKSMLDELGYSIPDDVSVVGFDNYNYACFLSPPLTTVKQPIFQIGNHAATIILEEINGVTREDKVCIVYGTELVIRNSVKNIKN